MTSREEKDVGFGLSTPENIRWHPLHDAVYLKTYFDVNMTIWNVFSTIRHQISIQHPNKHTAPK